MLVKDQEKLTGFEVSYGYGKQAPWVKCQKKGEKILDMSYLWDIL